MKNILCLVLSACIAMSFFSCSSEPREVVVEGKFKMDLPAYLKSTTILNEEASLQYLNVFKELYVMVIEDTPEELATAIDEYELPYSNDFDGFCQLLCSGEDEAFTVDGDYDKLEETTINGLQARILTDTRTVNGVEVYYKLAFVNGQKAYYQIISWTLPGRIDSFEQTIDDMINSFKEINQ